MSELASVIAGQYHERSRVFGSIQVVSIVAATLVLIAPSLVGSHSGAGDVRAMGWFIFIVTPLGIGFIVKATGSFVWALVLVAGLALVGALSYLFLLGDVKRVEID